MTGPQALAAFLRANALVKLGQYDEALQVPMLKSDCAVIAAKIERAKALAAGANTHQRRNGNAES